MRNLTALPEWQALKAHQKTIENHRMQDWFKADPTRFARFSLSTQDILLDYSKNRITEDTLNLLFKLAHAVELPQKIEALFSGKVVNQTERRAALHTALRDTKTSALTINNKNIKNDIRYTLDKIREFTEKVRNQTWRGCNGKPIRDIVTIGIGGSHLGPLMTIHALSDFANKNLRCHFISNIDSAHLREVLNQIEAETTLFIVSSKSFTTLETITNAKTIRNWLKNTLKKKDLSSHWIAITANSERAIQFGISPDNIFPLWDWVGGRYSIWSAIGLPLALMIGMPHFLAFLEGAAEMDDHFRQADFSHNMPVILALLGIWYINFFDANNLSVVPYSHYLQFFRVYLQQLDMESNGKNISQTGEEIHVSTGPVILGEQGCNGQHTFHQLLHQGPHFIPVDFILVGEEKNPLPTHQDILIGSALSQAQALMQGKSYEQAVLELRAEGMPAAEASFLAKHKSIPGNRPSNILLMKKMTPHTLGALIALYEHKIFVQGIIWNINSFDQWGVELGKQLLPQILIDLEKTENNTEQDASTRGLIQHYKNMRNSS